MKPTSKTPTKYEGISRLVWPSGRVTYEAHAPWWIDATGKRHNPMKTWDRLSDARTWRTEQLGRRQQGIKTPTGRMTLGAYLDGWIEDYATRNPGNTAANYRWALNKLRALPLWRAQLADVELEDIKKAYDAIPAKTVPYVHDALHLALGEAVPRRLGRNPAAGATKGRKLTRPERVVWEEDEYRAFLTAAAEDEWYPLWRTLGQSGMRRGELLGLDWPDIDLEARQVTIRRQYAVVAGKLVLQDVKTPRGRRTIDLDAETIAVLREWRKQQPTRRLGRDAHAVFTYPDGSRIGPTRSLGDRFHAVATRAGVRRLTVHDVRHTHASLLLRRGVALNVVSRRLGHANEAITLTTYAHLLRGQSRDAADVAAVIAAVRG